MIIDLEALAYVMKAHISFRKEKGKFNCTLEGVIVTTSSRPSQRRPATSWGHTPEAAADRLVHLLRDKVALKGDRYFCVPHALIVGEIGKEQ